ncbi:hypothetical protein HYALB_00006850 [Hymenoscyphus albidus]|uniref:Uncharacterized protein n=1 Tax=Hymenoscyphus albidus TaxID=595503 RepID=A0A9N9LES6_9HELO|nr:hypothetical protein HYALB_00006850 [Hymenoscyphus albidus]
MSAERFANPTEEDWMSDSATNMNDETSENELENWSGASPLSLPDNFCTLYQLNEKIRKKIYGIYFDNDYKSQKPHPKLYHDYGPVGPQVNLIASSLVAALRPCRYLYDELLAFAYDNQRARLLFEDSESEQFFSLCPATLSMVKNLSICLCPEQHPGWFRNADPSEMCMKMLSQLSYAKNIRALSLTIPLSEKDDVFCHSIISNILKSRDSRKENALREMCIHLEDRNEPVLPGVSDSGGTNDRLLEFANWVWLGLGRVVKDRKKGWVVENKIESYPGLLSIHWGLHSHHGPVYPRTSIFW